jgi:hypothetical protein
MIMLRHVVLTEECCFDYETGLSVRSHFKWKGVPEMSLIKGLFAIVLLAAVTVPQPLVGSLDNQDKAPAFSSPRAEMHENGDRVSHYPPYYHPESGGRR